MIFQWAEYISIPLKYIFDIKFHWKAMELIHVTYFRSFFSFLFLFRFIEKQTKKHKFKRWSVRLFWITTTGGYWTRTLLDCAKSFLLKYCILHSVHGLFYDTHFDIIRWLGFIQNSWSHSLLLDGSAMPNYGFMFCSQQFCKIIDRHFMCCCTIEGVCVQL